MPARISSREPVIPGRCEASNPESRDSPMCNCTSEVWSFGPSRNDQTTDFEANMNETDIVVIGAGHNGLTCAAYLAMAGLRVKVIERRKVVGGAAVTEEFYPGFRNSVAAYTVSLLNPKIIADLKLHEHGLRIVEAPPRHFLPSPAGASLVMGAGRPPQ